MADPIYTLPGDTKYFRVKYEDQNDPAKKATLENSWKHLNRYDPATRKTYYIWYRKTSPKSEVLVDYSLPASVPMGLYRIEAFVPGRHATTRQAIYTVAHNFRLENGKLVYDDTVAVIDMYHEYDVWISLGEYLVNPAAQALSGRVRQYVLSLEDPAASVSFGPIRWVPLATEPVEIPTNTGPSTGPIASNTGSSTVPGTTTTGTSTHSPRPEGAAQFNAPVGTQEERAGEFTSGRLFAGYGPIWLGNWYDATPFLSWYVFGYHTGADLNLTVAPAADKDAPIYAVADGKVTYVGSAGSWGNIIVIEHPDALVVFPSGKSRRQKIYSRYGHVSDRILVTQGEEVKLGQRIGFIGLMRGASSGWHLHFDISYTEILKSRPAHWPNLTTIKTLRAQGKENTREYANAQQQVKKEALAHYIDPWKFLKDNR